VSGPGPLRQLSGYRSGQLAARAAARLRRRIPLAPAPDVDPPPLREPELRAAGERAGLRFAGEPHDERTLRLVGFDVDLTADALWAPSGRSALLDFELHGQEWLVALPRRRAFELARSWVAACPPSGPALALSWHPYVLSTRVAPWTHLLASDPPPDVREVLARSLWRQLLALAGHVERDVRGNHLIRNASALAVGGAVFEGLDAELLRRYGLDLLERELADQLGPDGGHVERSPSYHAQVLWDAVNAQGGERLSGSIARGLGWLRHVSPPGQPRPHLNDSADGRAPDTAFLLAESGVAPTGDPEPRGLPRYAVVGDERTRLLLDAAEPSRPDLPYHAHADSLAILLTIDGEPVLVDRGVSTYTAGEERAWWRSTAAHSTVEVDRTESSEVVGAHRAGRLARTAIESEDEHRVTAAHDGAGRPRLAHLRRVARLGPRAWAVVDHTPGAAASRSRLHLAPGAEVVLDGGEARVRVAAARLRVTLPPNATARIEHTRHALRLGERTIAPTIVLDVDGPSAELTLTAESG
jgi:hypothetical protein